MLPPAWGFFVPKSRDHSDNGRLLAGPRMPPDWCASCAGCARRGRAGEAVAAMADHRDYFRQVAAECRRLAEIANKPEIKQRLLNMAAEYQAKADEHSSDR
jgi:hypothetical protein